MDGVSAVVLNVTVTEPTWTGFISVYAAGTSRPVASNLNYTPGQTVPNLVLAPVGDNGVVDLYNGSTGSTHLVADISGYIVAGEPGPGGLAPVNPARVLDTREGTGAPATVLGAGQTINVTVGGRAGVPPSGVSAVILNITVTEPAWGGFITAYPGSSYQRPTVSNVNYTAGRTVPNLAVVPLGGSNRVSFYNGSTGSTHLVADVLGYVVEGQPTLTGQFGIVSPKRILDTREGIGVRRGIVVGQTVLQVKVTGRGGIPATGVSAVVINVTVADSQKGGYITAFAGGTPLPFASNVNYIADQPAANLVFAPVGVDGTVNLYVGSYAATQLIADVSAYVLGDDVGPPAVAIDGGAFHYCVALTDGSAHCWGRNNYGQIGDGTSTNALIPKRVTGVEGAVAVAAGDSHSCAVVADGAVKCWGRNNYGQLGNGTNLDSPVPVVVQGLNGVKAITATADHTCAVLNEGIVRCWGSNDYGQLGDGSTSPTNVPTNVGNLTGAVTISSAARHTCVILSDGSGRCWGDNTYGQLVNGEYGYTTPTPVPAFTGITLSAISTGDKFTCGQAPETGVECAGQSSYTLGGGVFGGDPHPSPVRVWIGDATSISSGLVHSCAVTSSITRCWGIGQDGVLGNDRYTSDPNPVNVVGSWNDTAVAVANSSSCAVAADGTARCWGTNIYGELGNGVADGMSSPKPVKVGDW